MIMDFLYRVYGQIGRILRFLEEKKHPELKRTDYNLPGHTLYHFWISSYSLKARRALRQLGIRIPLRDVLLDDRSYRELVQMGGKDQVPCLRIERGQEIQWMYESDDIIAYLKTQKLFS